MSHRVHPKVYRIRRIADWDSRGYYKNPAEYLEEDFRVREFLRKKLGRIGVEKIEIERFPNKMNIIISSARPGLIIGRGGEGVEELKKELERKVLRKLSLAKAASDKETAGARKKKKEEKPSLPEKPSLETKKGKGHKPRSLEIKIEIREIRNPWTSASLTAQWVAQRIEKRIHHRRVLKQALSKVSANKEIQGVRIEVAGRLNGAEIARREWLKTGRLPRQTIRADIDYAKAEAYCTYGVIGIKVWIYKGEKFE